MSRETHKTTTTGHKMTKKGPKMTTKRSKGTAMAPATKGQNKPNKKSPIKDTKLSQRDTK